MKKNVLLFGIVSGVVASTFMFLSMLYFSKHTDFEGSTSMVVGYASMLIAFSFIFVAVKNYRDEYNNGVVTFGKAFQIGLYITLIASTCYVITWAFEYNFVFPDFMEKYSQNMIDQMIKTGASQQVIDAKTVEIAGYKEMYKNPLFFALLTYMEILPVGLVVSIISALILKRKEKPQVV